MKRFILSILLTVITIFSSSHATTFTPIFDLDYEYDADWMKIESKLMPALRSGELGFETMEYMSMNYKKIIMQSHNALCKNYGVQCNEITIMNHIKKLYNPSIMAKSAKSVGIAIALTLVNQEIAEVVRRIYKEGKENHRKEQERKKLEIARINAYSKKGKKENVRREMRLLDRQREKDKKKRRIARNVLITKNRY